MKKALTKRAPTELALFAGIILFFGISGVLLVSSKGIPTEMPTLSPEVSTGAVFGDTVGTLPSFRNVGNAMVPRDSDSDLAIGATSTVSAPFSWNTGPDLLTLENLTVTGTCTGCAGSLSSVSGNLEITGYASASKYFSGGKVLSTAATYTVSTSANTGDYTDIPTAVAAACAAGGGKVHVKSGQYTLTAPIIFSSCSASAFLTLEGEGALTEVRFNNATVPTAIQMGDTTQRSNITIKEMRLNQIGAAGTGTAINFSYFAISSFKNLWIGGINQGIIANASGTLYNTIEDVRISVAGVGGKGIAFDGVANENTIIRTRIITTTDTIGIYLDAHGSECYACNVETNALIGIHVASGAHDTLLSGVYLEGNTTNLTIDSGVEALTVEGGVIIDGDSFNITDNGGDGVCFINTRIQYEEKYYCTNIELGLDAGASVDTLLEVGGTASIAQTFKVASGKVDLTGIQASLSFNIGTATAGDNLVKVVSLEDYPNSTSTGGMVNVNNTGNDGAGLVIYSNNGATAVGRLLSVRADNAAFTQSPVNITNGGSGSALNIDGSSGTGVGVSITSAGTGSNHTLGSNYAGSSSTAAAGSFTSTNPNFTTLQISGEEFGHGTIKVTHTGSGSFDANAAAISIQLDTDDSSQTAAQGIYMTTVDMKTTGDLLDLRNQGEAYLTLTGAGRLGIGDFGPDARMEIVATTSIPYLYLSSTAAADGDVFSILNNGNVGIGVAAPAVKLQVVGAASVSTNFEVVGYASTSKMFGNGWTTAAGTPGSVCYVTTTGEITKNNALTCTVSDRDQKEGIVSLDFNASDMLLKLDPVLFAYKDAPDRERYGLIAQDVQAVDPKLGDAYRDGEARSLDIPALLSVVIKAIKEILHHQSETDTRIAALEARIAELEGPVLNVCKQ